MTDALLLAREIERINALGGTLRPGETDDGPGLAGWPSAEAVAAASRLIAAADSTPRGPFRVVS